MYTDKELYELLEDSGYKTTEENLATLKEGLESGKYEIIDLEDIFDEMVWRDQFDTESLCEFFDEKNLSDEDLDTLEEMFDYAITEEYLTEGVFSRIGRMAKGVGRSVKGGVRRIGDAVRNSRAREAANDTYHRDVDTSKRTYRSEVNKAKGGYKDALSVNKQAAKDQWKNLSDADRQTKKNAYKTAKDEFKNAKREARQAKKDLRAAKKADKLAASQYAVKNGAGTYDIYDKKGNRISGGHADLAAANSQIATNRTNASNNVTTKNTDLNTKKTNVATKKSERADSALHNTKRGYVKQAKDQTKAQRDSKIQAAKATRDSEISTARANKLSASGYSSTTITESYSDYELYQFLENTGYKTTNNNLAILKEGLDSGKYYIEFENDYSDYELYQVLENCGYETSEENLAILKEGLACGDYTIE